ncbi:MAG: hypothetical protein ACTSU2_09435 [Promethearchaeota archaeon]
MSGQKGKLYILGVNHLQKGLVLSLISLLQEIKPDIICLEYKNRERARRQLDRIDREVIFQLLVFETLDFSKLAFYGQELFASRVYEQESKEKEKEIRFFYFDRLHFLGEWSIPLLGYFPNRAKKIVKYLNYIREFGMKLALQGMIKDHKDKVILVLTGLLHEQSLSNYFKKYIPVINPVLEDSEEQKEG